MLQCSNYSCLIFIQTMPRGFAANVQGVHKEIYIYKTNQKSFGLRKLCTFGYIWLPLVTFGYIWLPLVTFGYLWLPL